MDLVTMLLACSLAADNSMTQAMVEIGSQNKPLMVSVAGGETKTFPTEAAATAFASKEVAQGHSINIGLMQIPSRWLEPYHLSMSDMFRPCKNMVIATRIVNDMREQCLVTKRTPAITNMQACALSIYQTGDPEQGIEYANKVLEYAKAHPFIAPEHTVGAPSKSKAKVDTDKSKAAETSNDAAVTPANPTDNAEPIVTTIPTTIDDQNAQR